MRLVLRRSERLGRTSRRRRAGRWRAALGGRYLRAMVTFVDDRELGLAYAASAGLCLPHMVRAAEREPAGPQLDTLVARTRDRWAEIGRDVASFVRKHDYRNREPFTAADAASYTRAFEMLAGARSLFGNDVHTRNAGPARRRSRGSGDPEGEGGGPPPR